MYKSERILDIRHIELATNKTTPHPSFHNHRSQDFGLLKEHVSARYTRIFIALPYLWRMALVSGDTLKSIGRFDSLFLIFVLAPARIRTK